MRAHRAPTTTEADLMKLLRYTNLMDKVRKWPEQIIGKGTSSPPAAIDRISDFNDARAGLTHAKTRGHTEYRELEGLPALEVVDIIAEYMVTFHQDQATRYPYWIFGWNYLNPVESGHVIIVLNDQQFVFSLRTFGMTIKGGHDWEEAWKNQFLGSLDGYTAIRDLLGTRTECEPKYDQFPHQTKLCRRWWLATHHQSCGSVIAPKGN
jgi:hypothetical protein